MKSAVKTSSVMNSAVETSSEPADPHMGGHREDPATGAAPTGSSSSPADDAPDIATVPTKTSSPARLNLKLKKSPSKKRAESSPTKARPDDGVVIGNFHAFDNDEQAEALLPRLVNGCSRVILPQARDDSPLPADATGNNRGNSSRNCNSNNNNNNHHCQRQLQYALPPEAIPLQPVAGPYDYADAEYDASTQCGVAGLCGCCQPLASRVSFLVIFCLTTVLQGMFYTYFASGLSTIQKLYRISSQMTGIVMSATEVGQIGGSMFLAYYGGSGHRPRWIAWGVLLFAVCTFLCAVPHFIFSFAEPNALHGSDDDGSDNAVLFEDFNTCLAVDTVFTGSVDWSSNSSLGEFVNVTSGSHQPCQDPSRLTNFLLVFFFLALVGVGIGQTAVVNLGIPYIDDNVANKDSPMYFATTSAVRILGPTLGFVLGSLCTRLYVTPLHPPRYSPADPRWVGAWWLGHIVVSALLLLTSFAMFLFPRRLPPSRRCPPPHPRHASLEREAAPSASTTVTSIMSGTDIQPSGAKVRTNLVALLRGDVSASSSRRPSVGEAGDEGAVHPMLPPPCRNGVQEYLEKPKLRDFPRAVRRLLHNPVLLLRTASSVLHILPIAGLYTFLPKYLETQFRLPVHTAAMLAGTGGILLMGVGILLSGVFIRYVRPSARAIAGWNAITAFLYCVGMVILMFIGCEQDDFAGLAHTDSSPRGVFLPPCTRDCGGCDDTVYAPVCTTAGETHFSACHLGCVAAAAGNGTTVQFSGCECLPEGQTAELRLCDLGCNALVWYIGVFAVFVVLHSTAEVGGMLLTLRCCEKQDKAMAMGLISLAIGLFGNMPCPIIYGSIVDSACIQWRTTCGTVGDCQLYDARYFRFVFHGITAGVMMLAFFVDVAVWMNSGNIDLQPDSSEEDPPYYYPERADQVVHLPAQAPHDSPRPSSSVAALPSPESQPALTAAPPHTSLLTGRSSASPDQGSVSAQERFSASSSSASEPPLRQESITHRKKRPKDVSKSEEFIKESQSGRLDGNTHRERRLRDKNRMVNGDKDGSEVTRKVGDVDIRSDGSDDVRRGVTDVVKSAGSDSRSDGISGDNNFGSNDTDTSSSLPSEVNAGAAPRTAYKTTAL